MFYFWGVNDGLGTYYCSKTFFLQIYFASYETLKHSTQQHRSLVTSLYSFLKMTHDLSATKQNVTTQLDTRASSASVFVVCACLCVYVCFIFTSFTHQKCALRWFDFINLRVVKWGLMFLSAKAAAQLASSAPLTQSGCKTTR